MPKKALPPSLWLEKVQLYIDEGLSGVICRALKIADDGEIEEHEECAIDEVVNRVPGIYLLVDGEGKVVSQCRITDRGERVSNNTRSMTVRGTSTYEGSIARSAEKAALQWSDMALYQAAQLEKKDAKIEKLQADVEALKDEMRDMVIAQNDESEGDEWVGVLMRALEMFEGKTVREKIKQAAERILARAVESGKLSIDEANRLVPIVNSELENLGGLLSPPKQVKAPEVTAT